MRRVRKDAPTRPNPQPGITTRQLGRLAWLHLIARPEQRGHPALFALAVAGPAQRAERWWISRAEGAAVRFREAAAKVTEEDWRQAAARARASGTIPA